MMQLDMTEFPLIWMTPHDTDHPEDEAHAEEMQALAETLLTNKERFVLLADRPPTLEDFKDQSREEKRLRAEFFKKYRSQFSQRCAAMIIVGSSKALPLMLQKAVEGISSMIGVPVLFADSLEGARSVAKAHLANTA